MEPTKPPFLFFLLLLQSLFFTGAAAGYRRQLLHQPLFPLETSPTPSQSPAISSLPPQQEPKQPFSTTPPKTPSKPFFPNFRSSPPPPAPAVLATFPANISTFLFPQKPSPGKGSLSRKLAAIAVAVSLFSAALIAAVAAVILHCRRRHVPVKSSLPDAQCLYPPNTATSDGGSSGAGGSRKPPRSVGSSSSSSNPSSEFLYLGTLVSSRGVEGVANSGNFGLGVSTLPPPYRKLDSPELRPLPPLPRNIFRRSSEVESSSEEDDEEFFSPRASLGRRDSPRNNSRNPHSDSAPGSPSIARKPDSPPVDRLAPTRPPPPPPLPPAGLGPPVHVAPSRAVELQNPGPVSPALHRIDGVMEAPRAKLKALHWDKVRASSDRAMVWDQIKPSSFQLNEEMIETLFTVNATNPPPRDDVQRQVFPAAAAQQENRVLDPKRSQNVAILLRALNVTIDEVCEALLEGNADTLGTELLESLLKMAPTKEEERKLIAFKDESPFKLGPAEKFLKAVLDVPFAFKRVEAMSYIANFDSEAQYLLKSFEILQAACEELRRSRMFLKLLEAVLKTGNRMNVGTNRGDAHAFKLDTLLKLVDVKGADGKTTLLHFVVQEIIKAEGYRVTGSPDDSEITQSHQSPLQDVEFRKLGLQVVSGLCGELTSIKKAAAMDSDVLSNEVSKLADGIFKIEEVVTLNEGNQKFSESMSLFLKRAKEEIGRIQAQEKVTSSMVKEITEYFHGNSSKEEAHPFRIFMVVRDFLSVLDKVCKEVGKINERTIVGAARSQHPAPLFQMTKL